MYDSKAMTPIARKTFTELLRQPGDVADLAERQDVHIYRRDGEDLLLSLYERELKLRESLELSARLMRSASQRSSDVMQAFVDALANEAPWTEFLPADDRRRFIEEFTMTAAACIDTGVFAPLGRLLQEWRATAAVYADPAIVGGLNLLPDEKGRAVSRPARRRSRARTKV
jgi:hypothetical protein